MIVGFYDQLAPRCEETGTSRSLVAMVIRCLRDGDAEAVLRLWATCEGLGGGPGDSVEGIARYLSRNPGLSLVAEDGPSIVAAVLCGHDGRRGYLYRLGVRADYRRQGLGRDLVRRCLSGLRAEGIPRCQVFVLADNAVARRFWEEMGGALRRDLQMLSIAV